MRAVIKILLAILCIIGIAALSWWFLCTREYTLFKKTDTGYVITATTRTTLSDGAGWDMFVTISNSKGVLFRGTLIKCIDALDDMYHGDLKVTDLALDVKDQSLKITFSGEKPLTVPVLLGKFEENAR
jgi:hypothetical protein